MIRNLLAVLLLGLSFAASLAAAAKPNIVLVTMDTTRADRMGFLGSKRGLTPHLDALAKQGTVFTRAYSQAPITTVSHATILTGTYPPYHGVNDFSEPLPENIPALAELLRRQGYHTAAFVGSLILDPVNGMAPGFNRGFDHYDAGYRLRRGKEDRYSTLERRAEQVIARALAWLEQNSSGPFFLWVHVFDPHEPYEAPGVYGRKYAKAPYDGEIAYTDAQVGKLLETLRARGLFKNTLIAVASDHGEAFGEHGEYTHGVFLYDTTIHVPLLIKFHAGHWASQKYDGRVSLVDLAPTILAAVGIPEPKEMQGRDLIPLLGRPPADLPSYAETQYTRRAFGWSALFTLRAENFLFVRAPRPELYDSAADPEASRDLSQARRAEVQLLERQLDAFRERVSGPNASLRDQSKVDPRIAEKLAALGYVSGGGPVTSKPDKDLPDPKDKIQVANRVHQATLAVEQEEPARAVPILRQVLSTDPQIFVAQMQLGLALSKLKNYREALVPLRKATEMMPSSGPAHFALGRALLLTGDSRTAAAHFEIVIDRIPQWANAHFMLGTAYATSDRQPEAFAPLRQAAKLDPRHFGANLVLGRLLAAHGQIPEGLPYLEKAVQLRPDSQQAHNLLAAAYEELGRPQDAARHRAIASRLKPSAEPPN
jgi:arylsulfatase A-like enzyme/Flp pilus assembly protein TadD